MSAANRSTSDRLWPVLTVFVLLLGSASALEVYARRREPQAIVIAVRGDATMTLSSDERGEESDGEIEADTTAPLDPVHAQARELARRGDPAGAVARLQELIAHKPAEPVLRIDLGYAQLLSGDPSAAVETLRHATELGTTSPYAYLNLGVALRRTGQLPEAAAALARSIELKPGFRAARLATATVLRHQKRFDDAAALLDELAASGGNAARAEALLALGRTRLAQHKPKAAQAAFERAIEWAPALAELRISIARAYLVTDSPVLVAKGRAAAEIAVQLAPDLAVAHSTLARAKELAGDVDGAYDAYQAALRLAPDYHHARRRVLRLALDRLDYSTARVHAERLLATAPEEPEHHFLAGLVAARASDLEGARSHYQAAIEAAAGNYPEASFNLGLTEKEAGRLAEAIDAYQQALARKPDYLAAYNNLGLAYLAAQRPSDAEVVFDKVLVLEPRYAPALVNLGKLRMKQKRYDDAAVQLERAVEARPGGQEGLLNLGVAYRKAGKLDRAIATYRELIAAQPRYVAAHYNLGIALERAKDDAGAQRAYEQALALDVDYGPARRHLAALLAEQGKLLLAKQHYQALVDTDPTDRRAWLGLAAVHRSNGDTASCTRAVRAASSSSSATSGSGAHTTDFEALRARCSSASAAAAL